MNRQQWIVHTTDFRWISPMGGGGIPDMTEHPGWYWLCQPMSKSRDDSPVKCLIVQDRTGNCLMPAPPPVVVAQDHEAVVYKSEVDSGRPFIVLSSFLWNASGTPDFGQLGAVRSDLLLRGTMSAAVNIVDKIYVVVVHLVRLNYVWQSQEMFPYLTQGYLLAGNYFRVRRSNPCY